jgi:hypothetical protein
VVDRVAVAPGLEGGEDEHADQRTEDVVAPLGGQERAVRAVVEDDVGAQQEPGGERHQRQDLPVRDTLVEQHDLERHQPEVGDDRGEQIHDAARDARPRERGDVVLPGGARKSGHARVDPIWIT